jgi:hypothetical protein
VSERNQTVAESLLVLGITAESIADSISGYVRQLVASGTYPDLIRIKVRQRIIDELRWLDRLIAEASERKVQS